MLKIRYHTFFKKDYKRVVKRGYDTKLMEEIILIVISSFEEIEKYDGILLLWSNIFPSRPFFRIVKISPCTTT